MTRYLLGLLALLVMLSIGAFCAYVAFMPTVVASLILIGLAIMFGLGVHVGNQMEPAPQGHRQIFPPPVR
jgi:hypothetical protein